MIRIISVSIGTSIRIDPLYLVSLTDQRAIALFLRRGSRSSDLSNGPHTRSAIAGKDFMAAAYTHTYVSRPISTDSIGIGERECRAIMSHSQISGAEPSRASAFASLPPFATNTRLAKAGIKCAVRQFFSDFTGSTSGFTIRKTHEKDLFPSEKKIQQEPPPPRMRKNPSPSTNARRS